MREHVVVSLILVELRHRDYAEIVLHVAEIIHAGEHPRREDGLAVDHALHDGVVVVRGAEGVVVLEQQPVLCKIATRAEIAEKNYSLTSGAYVGVAEVQDDDENFEERMKEIHKELNTLQNESNDLMAKINANLKELGLEV